MEIYDLHRAFVGDEEIFFRRTGCNPKLPTLLMLTGWPISSVSLVPLMSLLKNNLNCYALDLPGYGKAPLIQRNKFCGFDFYSNIIRKFQTEILSIPKVDFFGYSIGGVHAINYAFKYPNLINKLIISAAPYNGIKELVNKRAQESLIYALLENFKDKPKFISILNKDYVSYAVTQLMYAKIYKRECGKFESSNKYLIKQLMLESSKLDFKAALDVAHDLEERNFIEAAKLIKSQTLVIANEYDSTVKPYLLKRLANELIPHARLKLLKNATHASILTDYQKFVEPILGFLF